MRQDAGFAMADALIALLIAAFLLSSLIGVNATASQATLAAERRLAAAELARSILLSAPEQNTGDKALNGQLYSWVYLERRDNPNAILVHQTATVEWAGKNQPQSLTLKSARLEPVQ